MALKTTTISANGAKGHHKFTLTVNEDSTSVAQNTSSVSWSLVISPIVKDYDWISNQGKVKYSVVINGATYSGIIATYDGKSTVPIASGTETCWHDAAGSATISFSFSITDSTGWSFAPGDASASGSLALTAIPRQATISSAPNFTDEEDPTITYSNPAGEAVSSLDACISFDGSRDDIAYRPIAKNDTSYTFTLTPAEKEVLQKGTQGSNSRTVIFYVRTIINGTPYYDTQWRTLTIVNANPIIEPTVTDTNEPTASLTGGSVLIRHHSNAYFTTGAKAQKFATITAQSVTCGGVTLEGAAGTFVGVQSGDFVFTATDSRGNTTTLPWPVPFVDYVGLSCSIGSNKPDTDGNFTLQASGVCYNGNIADAGSNDLYVLYRYKVSGGSYSDWHEMSITKGESSYTATAYLTDLDYQTTYIFQCRAGDLVTTVTTDEVAIKSMPVFDWSETDFNFNVPVSVPELRIGGVWIDDIYENGTKDGWTYRKWRSGVMECWRRLQITTNVTSAWGSLYTSGALSATNLTYPYPFTELPQLTATLAPFGSGGFLMAPGSTYGSATQTGAFEIARGTSVSNAQFLIVYRAIGRWK